MNGWKFHFIGVCDLWVQQAAHAERKPISTTRIVLITRANCAHNTPLCNVITRPGL